MVLVHAERWQTADRRFVEITSGGILATLAHWNCAATRVALLADHVHFTMRLHYDVAPSEIISAVMNEVCEAHRGLRIWMDGFYVGTVGSYDMAVVRNSISFLVVSKLTLAKTNCFRWVVQVARLDASRAIRTAGNNSPTNIPMMAITTSNSTCLSRVYETTGNVDERLCCLCL